MPALMHLRSLIILFVACVLPLAAQTETTGSIRGVVLNEATGNFVEGAGVSLMWEKLYSKHANLQFIFSGDQSRTSAMRLDANRSVGEVLRSLMSDYTSSGPLRLYRFIPSENRVQVITYDTTKRALVETTKYVPDRAEHQFSIDYPMTNKISQ